LKVQPTSWQAWNAGAHSPVFVQAVESLLGANSTTVIKPALPYSVIAQKP